MNKQLLKAFNSMVITTRFKGFRAPGGIKYPGGITYYPRDRKTHEDPEYEPSKLFRVERIKPTKHNPYWQKRIMKDLHIDEDDRVAIVKNTPDNNARLWKIKHLIKVTPITYPYGEPSAADINYTVLKENGQCIVTKTLEPAPAQVAALEKFDNDDKKMDSTTLKKDSRHKWNNAFGGGL